MNPSRILSAHGDLVSAPELRAAGVSEWAVRSMIARGDAVRVCHGWIARRSAPLHAVVSVIQCGKLTGPSLLASLGAWDGCDARLHVLRTPNSHGSRRPAVPLTTFAASPIGRGGLLAHWSRELAPDPALPAWRTSVLDALVVCASTLGREQFVACLDSAVQRGLLSRAALRCLRTALRRDRRGWLLDLDARAESGLETLARLRLATFVGRLDVQVAIPGIGRRGGDGRVDLLIDGWLVVELDGDAFHDPVVDRDRTNLLIRKGYRVLRFGSKQVLEQWDDVVATVMEMLRYA